MDEEPNIINLVFGKENEILINGQQGHPGSWLITGINQAPNGVLSVSFQTVESFKNPGPFPGTTVELTEEEAKDFEAALKACRSEANKIVCPSCFHDPEKHDFAGCNFIVQLSTNVKNCGCLVPYGATTGSNLQ